MRFASPADHDRDTHVFTFVVSAPVRLCALACIALCSSAAAEADISFQSPSGNIRCEMTRGAPLAVRCDLGVDQQSYTNRPASCDGDWGTTFGLDQTGRGRLVCVSEGDPAPEVPDVLPYGRRAILDGIVCRSEISGVTCNNIQGGGFSVRRAEQRVF